MSKSVSFRRASALSPGKHGDLDWRVSLGGYVPEHSEVVFMVGMLLVAEDRYNKPGQLGRYYLWYYLDRLLNAKTPEAVIEVAQDVQDSIDEKGARPKERAA